MESIPSYEKNVRKEVSPDKIIRGFDKSIIQMTILMTDLAGLMDSINTFMDKVSHLQSEESLDAIHMNGTSSTLESVIYGVAFIGGASLISSYQPEVEGFEQTAKDKLIEKLGLNGFKTALYAQTGLHLTQAYYSMKEG